MSLGKYLTVMAISNAGLWAAWVLVIYNLDPSASGRIGLALFYAALFFAITGTMALIGFALRALFFRNVPVYRHLAPSHRQGFLIALLVVASLVLQAARLFAWWNAALLLAIVIGIEYFFLSRQRI